MPQRPPIDAPDRSCILVLGMHRSGTSALTGVLGLLGITLPGRLILGDERNQKGYFESIPLNTLNEDMLAAMDSRWDDWRALDPAPDATRLADFHDRANGLIDTEFGDAAQFVFKDPRNCRMLHFWVPLLSQKGCRVVALHTLRNPWEVAASLSRRDGLTTEHGLLLWLRHTLDAERNSRDLTRYHTSYDLLLGDWRGVAEGAEQGLDMTWPRAVRDAAPEINAFLAGDLRHFTITPTPDSTTWAWVSQTHDIIRQWTMTGENAADHPRLDAIAAQFRAAEPGLHAMLIAARTREAAFRDLTTTAGSLKDSVAKAELGWKRASDQLAELQLQTDGVRRVDLDRLEQIRDDLNAQLRQSDSALRQRTHEAQEQFAALTESQREAIELRHEVARLTADAERTAHLLNQAETAVTSERSLRLKQEETQLREMIVLKARQAQTRDQLAQTDARHATLHDDLAAARAIQHDLLARLPDLETALAAAITERDHHRADAAALRGSSSWRITAPIRRVVTMLRRH